MIDENLPTELLKLVMAYLLEVFMLSLIALSARLLTAIIINHYMKKISLIGFFIVIY
jgi:hypothetical protein